MSRQVKSLMIESIQASLSDVRDILVVNVSRVSAVSINRIRLQLAQQNIHILFVKNAVASRVLSDLGLKFASQVLIGPSAIVFGDDDISTISKELSKCVSLDKEFEIRSGISDGRVLSASDVETLIKSPGKAELLSQLSAIILTPGCIVASSISGCYGSIGSQIDRLSRE